MSDAGVEPDDLVVSTKTAADCVNAERRQPSVTATSSGAPPAEPVDERATELGVERAVEEEVEREVGQLQRVEDHPRQHHRFLVDGRRLTERTQVHDEVEELARVDKNDQHHDDRNQRRVESVTAGLSRLEVNGQASGVRLRAWSQLLKSTRPPVSSCKPGP